MRAHFSTEGLILYQKLREAKIGTDCQFTVEQHIKTVKYIRLSTQDK